MQVLGFLLFRLGFRGILDEEIYTATREGNLVARNFAWIARKERGKGDDRRGIEPIFHARIHLEGYDGRPDGRSVAFAFVGY